MGGIETLEGGPRDGDEQPQALIGRRAAVISPGCSVPCSSGLTDGRTGRHEPDRTEGQNPQPDTVE